MSTPKTRRLYALLAAEPSGDLQAAALVPHLRALDPDAEFIGIGGRQLEKQGVKLLCDTSWWGSIGASEVLTRLPRIIFSYYRFRAQYARLRPDVTVMIDSPAVFMRLAKFTKKKKLKTIYYFPPSAWSDNPKRMKQIADRVTGVVATFRRNFEVYQSAQIPVEYHGHPMMDVVDVGTRDEALEHLGLPDKRYITLLPGSRLQEIRLMTPILVEAARLLKEWDPTLEFLLPAASTQAHRLIEGQLIDGIRLFSGRAQEMLKVSELALMTSGSVSLEAAVLDCPMVLGYRFNRFDAALGRFLLRIGLLKIDHFALPNLVLDESLVPELLQEEVTPERLFEEATGLLVDGPQRQRMLDGLARVREALGEGPVVSKVADYVYRTARGLA